MTETSQKDYCPPFEILFEDNHIIVVLKPQMTACCPDESKDDNLLDQIKAYLKIAYNKPGNAYAGLVHRLDRPTGGVMVYAKTSKAAARLTEGLQSGDFEKKYLTVLCGTPETERGTLVNYLRKNAVNNMMYICTQTEEGAKFASLDYRVLESKGRYSLAEVRLHTGRLRGHALRGRSGAEGQACALGIFSFLYSSRNEGTPALHGISSRGGNALEGV